MKKIFAAIAVLLMSLSLSSCVEFVSTNSQNEEAGEVVPVDPEKEEIQKEEILDEHLLISDLNVTIKNRDKEIYCESNNNINNNNEYYFIVIYYLNDEVTAVTSNWTKRDYALTSEVDFDTIEIAYSKNLSYSENVYKYIPEYRFILKINKTELFKDSDSVTINFKQIL